jgi:hypothetical protein
LATPALTSAENPASGFALPKLPGAFDALEPYIDLHQYQEAVP